MDNLKILKTIVNIRDKWDEDVYLGIFLEGFLGIFIILLSILTLFYNLFFLNAILTLSLITLYGFIMRKRIKSMRKTKRLFKFINEVYDEK